MAHFFIISLISSLFAFGLSGWAYRENRKLRWFWFVVVRVVIMVIAYLPPR